MNEAKIRVAIVDDETTNADVLQLELELYCPEVEVVAICYSAKDALFQIPEVKPDLVFLDIEMPFLNGFELLELMKHHAFHVVFVTAYSGYMVQAMKASAVDYLLKPVSKSSLQQAIDSYKNRVIKDHQNIATLIKSLKSESVKNLSRIALPSNEGFVFHDIADIILFKSEDMYTYVFLTGGGRIFLSKPLKYFEEILQGQGFFRIHKSYLINLMQVQKFIRQEGGHLIMSNDLHVPISKSKKDEFLRLLKV
jgi:two-component system, LytTR family, response regulator